MLCGIWLIARQLVQNQKYKHIRGVGLEKHLITQQLVQNQNWCRHFPVAISEHCRKHMQGNASFRNSKLQPMRYVYSRYMCLCRLQKREDYLTSISCSSASWRLLRALYHCKIAILQTHHYYVFILELLQFKWQTTMFLHSQTKNVKAV